MPWRTATVANERARFVIEAELSDPSHSELCRRYGISRPTGYRWIERYQAEGLLGLEDRSHAPRLRRVSGDATLRWKSRKVFVSSLLKGLNVGLEQVEDAVWSVYFGPAHLGWLDERDFRIMDVKERSRRRR